MITEVSSFQLQTVSQFKPKVSAILNLTPDHLNRHHTMELYGAAKAAIWKNQGAGDYLIMNMDDPVLLKLCLEDIPEPPKAILCGFSRKKELEIGAFLQGDRMVIRDEEGRLFDLMDKNELRIPGDHNVENALAAAAICFFAGITIDVIVSVLREFGGVEHRLEFVEEINGVQYYNDSKGTNTDASLIAIRALKENIILIAGGDAKEQDFTEMAEELSGPVKHVLLFGRDRGMIKEAMDKAGYTSYSEHADLEECVNKAYEMSVPGDKVLLSPACASWDMYPNFEVRGRHFKECVNKLQQK
jgi:UDP-N-acetylmuramoylalanine--D-glutamate ligase